MRVAALYDIHGHLPALEAVLSEVERLEPDVILAGGDMALGPMPRETLDMLAGLDPEVRFLCGNTDRELVEWREGRWTIGPPDDVWVRRIAWAAGEITAEQHDLLAGLPETLVLDADGVGPVLFCHGSPRSDEERITRETPDQRLGEMLAGVRQRIVVCGHTHAQFDRVHAGTRVVNAGSVGLPREPAAGAYWALLGPDVSLRWTRYDEATAARRIRATAFPEA